MRLKYYPLQVRCYQLRKFDLSKVIDSHFEDLACFLRGHWGGPFSILGVSGKEAAKLSSFVSHVT